ncbi:hypothetical protein R50072_01260 [Simiduia litorea]|uniref:DUF3859 domain-containing protein n=1 Tax=Simiduia litorea TaxID=1435348 RepID=UPI0036F3C84D
MKNYLILLLLILLAGCAGIHSKKLPYGKIEKYGIVEKIKDGGIYQAPDSLAGYAEDGVETEIRKITDIIPLKRDIIFGMNWCAYGLPNGNFDLVYRISHPITSRPGKKPSRSFEEIFSTSKENDGPYCTGDSYKLHEEWEMVSGAWKLEVIYQGKALVSKKFKVVER